MPTKEDKDTLTGTQTTGHEWDGVKELNNPLPKWWLYIFWVTIVWSVIVVVLYPSIPLGGTYFSGLLGYSAREDVEKELAAAEAAKGDTLTQIASADLETIRTDDQLLSFSLAGGRTMFLENCAPCHGSGAQGGPGYPNLSDDAWLWGGDLEAIQTTLRHGIRWEQNDESRFSQMPAFGGILSGEETVNVANHVLSLSGQEHDAAKAEQGQPIFNEQCAICHKEDGSGDRFQGAPALNDQVWLYGGGEGDIRAQITEPQHGVMPAWENRLDPTTIKMLSVYVHSLGGGEAAPEE